MTKSYFTLLITLLFVVASASAQTNTRYWIYLKDKNNSPYSINNPSEFLSEKSLQRRADQGISIKTDDLPVNPLYIQGISSTGVTVLFASKWLNAVEVSTSDPSKLNMVNSLPYVASIKQVKRLQGENKRSSKYTVEHKSANVQKTVSTAAYNYGQSYRQINMLGGDILHNQGYKGQGMVIAVLDAGFTNVNILDAFDSLRNDNRILGTRDFVTGDNDVYSDHSHGTYVLSTMAAILPGQLIGTAPNASYWLIRTEEAATETLMEESNWVRGAEFADSVGADIINSSLGYTVFDNPSYNHTYADMDGNTTIITRGADIAASKGILVVNSAGNDGDAPWHYIAAPADGDSVLTIGAVDSNKTIAAFSSRGPSADGRVKPNVCAMGEQSILAGLSGGVFAGNGTSFSSPIMAGMAACLWQANRTKTNMEIYNAIQKSADRFNNPNDDYGYGIPNFSLANIMLTGIENIEQSNKTYFEVYPNPFISELNFIMYSTDGLDVELSIYSLNGKQVLNQFFYPSSNSYMNGRISLNNDLAAGMYFMKIKSGSEVSVKKIIRE